MEPMGASLLLAAVYITEDTTMVTHYKFENVFPTATAAAAVEQLRSDALPQTAAKQRGNLLY